MSHPSPAPLLTDRLESAARRRYAFEALAGLGWTLAGLGLAALIALIVEALAGLPTVGRTTLVVLLFVGLIGALIVLVGRPLLMRLNRWPGAEDTFATARRVGAARPEIGDRMVNGLQVARNLDTDGGSPELARAALSRVEAQVADVDLSGAITDPAPVRRSWQAALIPAALLGLAASVGPLAGAAGRLLHPSRSYAPPAPFALRVEPGDAEIVRGGDVAILARAVGPKQPAKLVLLTYPGDRTEPDEISLTADSSGVFRYTLKTVQQTTRYRIEARAEHIQSDEHTLTALDRPGLAGWQITVTPPSYTGQPVQQLPAGSGDVRAPRGSEVALSLRSSGPVGSGALVFAPDSLELPVSFTGTAGRAAFRLMKDGTYRLRLTSPKGVVNADPIRYTLRAVPDAAPAVRLVQPDFDGQLDPSLRIGLVAEIQDDYGFSKLLLHYRLAESKFGTVTPTFRSVALPLPDGGPARTVGAEWNLGAALDLAPDDVVEYYLEVWDNDRVLGPKSARTGLATLRFPSLTDVLAQTRTEQAETETGLQQAVEQGQELQKAMAQMQEQIRRTDQVDWRDQRQVDQMQRQQQSLQQSADQLAQQLQQQVDRMGQNQMLSPETLQKYQQVQQLLQQIDSPALKAAMERMQQAMQTLDPNQVQQAMANLAQNQEAFQKSLERTMKLLQRIQLEQSLDTAAKQARELAEQEAALAKQAQATNPNDKPKQDQLAKAQADLRAQSDSLRKDLAKTEERMQQFDPREMPTEEMRELMKQLDQAKAEEKMRAAEQQMERGEPQAAQQNMQQAAQEMASNEQRIQQLKQQLLEKQQNRMQAELRSTLDRLLKLSRQQEDLRDRTRRTAPNSPESRQLAEQQRNIAGDLAALTDSLARMSEKNLAITPKMGQQIGQALAQMSGALDNLQNRNTPGASGQQGAAMAGLNGAALQMGNSLQQMQGGNPGGGQPGGMGGMMQQLEGMAGQQEGINQSTQQMGENGSGGEGSGRPKADQAARMQQLAGQQAALQQALQQLAQQAQQMAQSGAAGGSSGDNRQPLGDLSQVAKQMDEVAKALASGSVTRETIQRQQQILSRMLDASRSVREREFDKTREAHSGGDIVRASPPALPPAPARAQLRQSLLNATTQGYSADYEALIKRYFEALERADVGTAN